MNTKPLAIPANWAEDFLEQVDFSAVGEVYGKLPHDEVGGGRASVLFLPVSRRFAARQIGAIRARGMRFNYLLNATCLDNREFSRAGRNRIRRLLDWISEAGADTVTLGLPQLVTLVKKEYPHLRVAITTNVMADNLERVRYWEEWGADQITLSYTDLNRDFGELRRIAAHARCEIVLLCNLICRRFCPFQSLHANFHSHASQSGHGGGRFPLDFYCLHCAAHSFTEPVEILRSPWIRPEDLALYEAAGLRRFKLAERGLRTPELARIVRAYTERRYDGNLLDLIPSLSKYRFVTEASPWHWLRYYAAVHRVRAGALLRQWRRWQALRAQADFARNFGLHVDNAKLDGFLAPFQADGCRGRLCEECGHCARWAARAVRVEGDPAQREAAVRTAREFVDELATGLF